MIEENVPLAPFTTFRLGGPGRYFVRVRNLDELKRGLSFANEKQLQTFYLGGGSNVLVRDDGFPGLVIKVECVGVEPTHAGYIVAAGEDWDALVARAVADGLWGVENLSGIPGTVGGAVVQNIGAYGAALSQAVEWVEAFDTHANRVVRLSNAECAFGYRDSVFKQHEGRFVVLRAALTLWREPRPNLLYKDLAAHFLLAQAGAGQAPSLAAIRQVVLDVRRGKFPDLTHEGSAGSFFLNPVVPAAAAEALKARYPDMPLFDMPETNNVKVPLGWLLDRVLNLKGLAVGGARLYERQALVVAAARGATARDVLALRDKVKKDVQEKLDLEISEEVKIL